MIISTPEAEETAEAEEEEAEPEATTAPEEEAEPEPEGPVIYVVQPGDTLFRIARRFGVTVADLVALNGLDDPDRLAVGTELIVSTPEAEEAEEATPESEEAEAVLHVVQPGETLGHIALRYGLTYQALALLNGLDNPNLIYPGQVLIIREGATIEAEAAATPTSTEESTPEATLAPTDTPTPEPTDTTPPTETPSPTTAPGEPTPTPLFAVVPEDALNLLDNPGFEGETRPVVFGEINVFEGWQPFYCDRPYTPDKCPAPRQGNGNPVGLEMGRPAFQSTAVPNRVHSGETAQQWYCFRRSCRAGVFQTVEVSPGVSCEAGAWVQSWSADGTGFTSDLETIDARANSNWRIIVDLAGGDYAFAAGLPSSRAFDYDDDIYDQYTLIRYTFQTTGPRVTVFFENLRLWPIINNDNYIDDAYLRCGE